MNEAVISLYLQNAVPFRAWAMLNTALSQLGECGCVVLRVGQGGPVWRMPWPEVRGRMDELKALVESGQDLTLKVGDWVLEEGAAPDSVTLNGEAATDRQVEGMNLLVKGIFTLTALPMRAVNCLVNEDYIFWGEVIGKTDAELMKIHQFGAVSLAAVKKFLAEYDLRPGMRVEGWERPGG